MAFLCNIFIVAVVVIALPYNLDFLFVFEETLTGKCEM